MNPINLESIGQYLMTNSTNISGFEVTYSFMDHLIKFTRESDQKVDLISLVLNNDQNPSLNIGAGIALKNLNAIRSDIFQTQQNGINIWSTNYFKQIGQFIDHLNSSSLKKSDDGSLDNFLIVFDNYLMQQALPFFNHINNEKDLIPLIENISIRKLGQLFTGSGILDKAIIYKLSNHPDAFTFIDNLETKYKTKMIENPTESAYKEHLELIQKARKFLEM